MINGIKKFLLERDKRFLFLNSCGVYNFLPDDIFARISYKALTGKRLNLKKPHTFNEKLQWLKIKYHNPQYTIMVDKYLVKEYVAQLIGDEYIVPLLGVWDNPDDIQFEELPPKFVLKCNHNSGGGMYICKDKSTINITAVRNDIKRALDENYYIGSREWPYKNVDRKVFAEQYMEDKNVGKYLKNIKTDGLVDYKFYCFNGQPKFFYIGFANMVNGIKSDLLSFLMLDWTPAPFGRTDHAQWPTLPEKPLCFDKMVELAGVLASGIPFVRVDFFVIDEHIYFSEFTFTPGAGYGLFYPEEWEKTIGDWIVLPSPMETSYEKSSLD